MIEVEKKFFLDEKNKQDLIFGAELIGTKVFKDTYYDNSTFDLTSKDLWLRLRETQWELKISFKDIKNRVTDQYRELETESEIADYLKLSKELPLAETLANAQYKPFASFTTTRKKYKKEGFIIDLDVIDFGYEIAEIEKMVEDESEMAEAEEAILKFAQNHNLKTGQVRGKLVEFIKRNDRNHFNILVEAGVVLKDNITNLGHDFLLML